MKQQRLILSIFTVILLLCVSITTYATQSHYEAFITTGFTATGDATIDMPAIAALQIAQSQTDFGYTEDWCADFIIDCAIYAGQTSAIPSNGTCSGLRKGILDAGGTEVTSPKAGDIVFFYVSGAANPVHVALMIDDANCIHGNYSWSAKGTDRYVRQTSVADACAWDGRTASYVRPAYTSGSSTTTTTTTTKTTPTSSLEHQYGDVNWDNSVDLKDILALRRHLVGFEETVYMQTADMDKNGVLDMKDVLQIRIYVANAEYREMKN